MPSTRSTRAGTPLSELVATLDQHGQMLPFEPPDWRGLLGASEGEPFAATIL